MKLATWTWDECDLLRRTQDLLKPLKHTITWAVRNSFEATGVLLTFNRITVCDETEANWYVKLGVHLPCSVLSWRTDLQLQFLPHTSNADTDDCKNPCVNFSKTKSES